MEAADCIETGLKRALFNIRVKKIPMADGGEGTMRTIMASTGGKIVRLAVKDPLGRKIQAEYGLTGDGRTAVIEMAAASGVMLLKPAERDPLKASTFGTGELIRSALDRKVDRIIIGIGGSATNDGGAGMARALGVKFLDSRGREIADGGGALIALDRIEMKGLDRRLKDVLVEVACDVDNPLTGARGASRVYGPQKGATPAMAKQLDANLKLFAGIVKRDVGVDVMKVPGGGAAGGIGAGLMAFAGARLRPGVDIVIEIVKLEKKLKGCDLVITGEGRIDGQTVHGKTPAGVARAAKRLGLPVIAICGSIGKGADKVHKIGIDAYFSALNKPVNECDLRRKGPVMLVDCAEQVGRILALKQRSRKSRGRDTDSEIERTG